MNRITDLTDSDFAAAQSEADGLEPLSPLDLAALDNSEAVKRADAQFGRRPIHARGIDQVWFDIANVRPVLPEVTAIAMAHVNEINRVANEERTEDAMTDIVQGGQGRDAMDVAETGNALTAFFEVVPWVIGSWLVIFAFVKGCV